MNKEQQNTLDSYAIECNVCRKYSYVWEKDPAFCESFSLFEKQLPRIKQYRDFQANTTGSATAVKKEVRDEVVSSGAFIANRLQRYAYKIQDTELAKSIDYTEWDLRRATTNNLLAISNLLITKASNNIEWLKPYSLDQNMLDNFITLVNRFSDMAVHPQTTESQSKNATIILERLFKETDSILAKGLDLDIEVYKKSHPDFYNEYQAARKVNKAASTITAIRAKVSDKDTQKPIKSVSLTFVKRVNGNEMLATATSGNKMTRKTTDKGNLRIANMVEGIYELTVIKTGYKIQTLIITVLSRETLVLEITLEKA